MKVYLQMKKVRDKMQKNVGKDILNVYWMNLILTPSSLSTGCQHFFI